MQFMLIFYPIIGTVMIELFKSDINAIIFLIVAIGTIVLIVYTTTVVTKRITSEHQVYIELSQQVLLIWTHFGLFEKGAYLNDRAFLDKKLLDEQTGLGRGQGYKKTQRLIWTASFTVIVILAILATIKILVV
jgi:hypothetical protein